MDLFEFNANLMEQNADNLQVEYSRFLYNKFLSEESKIIKDPDKFNTAEASGADDFDLWLKRREELCRRYSVFLRNCHLNPTKASIKKGSSIELFKGKYDSLKTTWKAAVQLYSKYASTLDYTGKKNGIFPSVPTVRNGKPGQILVSPQCDEKIFLPFDTEVHDRYYVHNPENANELRAMESLLQNDDITVIFGLYGFVQDEDLSAKIKRLRALEEVLEKTKEIYPYFFQGKSRRSDSIQLPPYQMLVVYKPKRK